MKRTLTLVLASAVAAFTAVAPAQAAAVYSYSGPLFINFPNDSPPAETYDFGMRVTGSFTVAAPLLSVPFGDISASVLSFSFNDGRQTLTSADSSGVFQITTNAAGVPTDWSIFLLTAFPATTSVGDLKRSMLISPVVDFGEISYCAAVNVGGGCTSQLIDRGSSNINLSTPTGSWTVTLTPDPDPVPVPEPASLALLGLGLAGLSLARRRRA